MSHTMRASSLSTWPHAYWSAIRPIGIPNRRAAFFITMVPSRPTSNSTFISARTGSSRRRSTGWRRWPRSDGATRLHTTDRCAGCPLWHGYAAIDRRRVLVWVCRSGDRDLRRAEKRRIADEADDDEGPAAKAVSQIHVRWLTTPRDDLNGQAPRDVLLAKHKFIDWDLQDRVNQWSWTHKCPPGLDRDSHAFRFAGFGTHEIVVYYELVRDLVWSCFDQIKTIGDDLRAKAMTVGDFLAAEIPRLDALREERWNEPDPECRGLSPRQVAEHERARLPEGMSGHEAVVDPDCPLCEMVADMPGPVFWHLDGCNMDQDFAFSFHRTREEWEQEEEKYREFNRRFDAAQAERKRLYLEAPECQETDGVWQFSHVEPEVLDHGPVFGMFGIGSHLAELIVDLKEPVEERVR